MTPELTQAMQDAWAEWHTDTDDTIPPMPPAFRNGFEAGVEVVVGRCADAVMEAERDTVARVIRLLEAQHVLSKQKYSPWIAVARLVRAEFGVQNDQRASP